MDTKGKQEKSHEHSHANHLSPPKISITKNTSQVEIIKLAPPCHCHQCRHGCTMGSGILSKADYAKLSTYLRISIDELKEKFLEETIQFNKTLHRPKIKRNTKTYGACIFYDTAHGCTVHEAKPLQCKISMGCKEYGEELIQWFLLNHIIDLNDPLCMREFEVYLKSQPQLIEGADLIKQHHQINNK